MFEGSAVAGERTLGKTLPLAPHWRFQNLPGIVEDHETHKSSIRSELPCFLTGFGNLSSRPSVWPASVVPATADVEGMTELDRERGPQEPGQPHQMPGKLLPAEGRWGPGHAVLAAPGSCVHGHIWFWFYCESGIFLFLPAPFYS